MLKPRPIHRLVIATGTIALALTSTHLRADTFAQVNLVSNVPGLAAFTDPNLINPWGVSNSATSPFWVSNQGTGTATLYSGTGAPQGGSPPLVVTIPGGGIPSGPTGQVFNSAASGFNVGATKATFIFDNLNGTIAGWNGGTTATVEATLPGAIFTGLTQGAVGGTTYLYAANSSGGNIQVFDSTWTNVTATTFANKFADPNAKSGSVPFNIQQVGTNLYVTYANLGPGGTPLPGGYVIEYDSSGNIIAQINTGPLSAPWGLTLAPANFGIYSNDLLIGQFGSGQILAYDPTSEAFLGILTGLNGLPIVNDRLWALETRTGGAGVNLNAVYFTAGINGEQGGLFGQITEVPEPASILGTASGLIAFAMMKIRSRLR
jgi:uncharacterized protein (TIGR03118 family)